MNRINIVMTLISLCMYISRPRYSTISKSTDNHNDCQYPAYHAPRHPFSFPFIFHILSLLSMNICMSQKYIYILKERVLFSSPYTKNVTARPDLAVTLSFSYFSNHIAYLRPGVFDQIFTVVGVQCIDIAIYCIVYVAADSILIDV